MARVLDGQAGVLDGHARVSDGRAVDGVVLRIGAAITVDDRAAKDAEAARGRDDRAGSRKERTPSEMHAEIIRDTDVVCSL
jgi:hypothetical protein